MKFVENDFGDIFQELLGKRPNRTKYIILFGCAIKFTDSAVSCPGGHDCTHFDQCQKTALREGWMGWDAKKI